jgi:hypothetical protein
MQGRVQAEMQARVRAQFEEKPIKALVETEANNVIGSGPFVKQEVSRQIANLVGTQSTDVKQQIAAAMAPLLREIDEQRETHSSSAYKRAARQD